MRCRHRVELSGEGSGQGPSRQSGDAANDLRDPLALHFIQGDFFFYHSTNNILKTREPFALKNFSSDNISSFSWNILKSFPKNNFYFRRCSPDNDSRVRPLVISLKMFENSRTIKNTNYFHLKTMLILNRKINILKTLQFRVN